MKILHSGISLIRRLHYGAGLDPVRDWLVMLMLSIIAFVGIVVWNIWAFDTVANGGAIGITPSAPQQLFNHTSLDAIHTVFEKRADEEAKYVTGVYRYADPSQ